MIQKQKRVAVATLLKFDGLNYCFLPLYLTAPIPAPAARRRVKPPSIGQAGSNGSPQGSGGGSANEFAGFIVKKNKVIVNIDIILLVVVISLVSNIGLQK